MERMESTVSSTSQSSSSSGNVDIRGGGFGSTIKRKINSHRLEIKKSIADKNDHDKATMLAATEIGRGSRMIKDLITHLVFFVVFLIIIITQRNSSYVYRINSSIKNALINNEIDGLQFPKPYMGINNQDDFNSYLTNQFAPTVATMSAINGTNSNKVIGNAIRFRQLRVSNDSCPTYGYNMACYAVNYNSQTRDTKNIIGSSTGTVYRFTKDSHGPLVFGYNQYVYQSSGYVVDIPVDNIQAGVETLINDTFFDIGTRAVVISFVSLNVNYEARATVAYFLTEWSAASSIDPYYTMRTYRIEMYSNALDRFRAFLEISFLVFLLYYLYYFINEARIDYHLGRFRYFMASFWNILEVVNLSLFIASVILYLIFLGDNNRKIVHFDETNYPTYLELLGQTALVFYQLSAINILLLSFKTFRFLVLHRRLYALWITLSHAKVQLITFTTMFIIMMIGFLMSGWLTFGHEMSEYNGFINALGTSLQFIVGNPPSYTDMQYTNRALGPIYYLLFTIFMFFILMNMFVAIISNSYSEIVTMIHKKQKSKKKALLTKWRRYALSIKFLFRKNIYEIYDIARTLMENKPGLIEEQHLTHERILDEIQNLGLGIRFDEAQYYTDLMMKVHSERKKYLEEIIANKQSGGTFEMKLIGKSRVFKTIQMHEWLEEQEKLETKRVKEQLKEERQKKEAEYQAKIDRILSILGDEKFLNNLKASLNHQYSQNNDPNNNNQNNFQHFVSQSE